jgi:type VI protein secretion system component VasK
MEYLDTGVISLLIASGTLLLGLLGFIRIQQMRLAREYRVKNEQTERIAAETREMRNELTALNAQIAELRRMLTEAA